MANFSFPVVDLQGIGPCVTRRVLIERAGVTASQLTQLQQTLVKDQDYFYMPNPNGGMACNYYRIAVIQRIAQAFPTVQAQQMAHEVTAFMGAQYGNTPALPSGNDARYAQTVVQPETSYSQRSEPYGQTYRDPQRTQSYAEVPIGHSNQAPMTQLNDPRVAELSSAIARNLQAQMLQPQPQQAAMTQAELLQAARTLQSDAVGYVKQGFTLAATAQSQTADMIRRSRPNITNNTDNRRASYNLYELVEQRVGGMSQLQFGLLVSAVFCLVASLCYATASMNQSSPQYAPTSAQTQVRSY